MTRDEAVALIFAKERRILRRPADRERVRAAVEAGEEFGYYYATFYYVPDGVLTDDEDWTTFERAHRFAVSEIVGYPVRLTTDGWGNGHGGWRAERSDPRGRPCDLDDVLALVAAAREVRPPDGTLHPSVALGGFEVAVSDLLAPGTLLPLGPFAYAVARRDFDNARVPEAT